MIRFKTLSLLVALATLSFACEREVITPATTPTAALYGTTGLVAPAPQCGSSNLTHITNAAGSNLGAIEIANDQNSIYVMISMNPTRFMEELRVFAGDASTLDNDGTGNLLMEGFQFQSTFSAPQSRYTVILPKAGLGACVDIVLYGRVATRNAFGQMTNRTYVWADGLPLFNVETYKYCLGTCAVTGGGSGSTH
jgi:hypothetical protein